MIVNWAALVLVSVLVAVTSIVWLVAVSASTDPFSVTTPVEAWIWKRSLSKTPAARPYVTVSVTSGSLAWAVICTAVPVGAFSGTSLSSVSMSLTAPTGESLSSIVRVCLSGRMTET